MVKVVFVGTRAAWISLIPCIALVVLAFAIQQLRPSFFQNFPLTPVSNVRTQFTCNNSMLTRSFCFPSPFG